MERVWIVTKKSKIEVLLRLLHAAQKEVQMLLASEEYRFEGRSIASRASETGGAFRDAVGVNS